MDVALIVFIIVVSVYFAIYCYLAYKTGNFKKTVAISVGSGIGSLTLLSLLSPLTGIWLPFNFWTLGSSAAVGLPAVVAMLILRLIMV